MRRLIEARPDITPAEIQAELHERLGILAGTLDDAQRAPPDRPAAWQRFMGA
jgi:hypothetical protein